MHTVANSLPAAAVGSGAALATHSPLAAAGGVAATLLAQSIPHMARQYALSQRRQSKLIPDYNAPPPVLSRLPQDRELTTTPFLSGLNLNQQEN